LSNITLFERAVTHAAATAIRRGAVSWTYADILEASGRIAAALLDGADDLREQRVAILLKPGFYYVVVQWAAWRAGAVAVPLSLSATEPELEHYLSDSGAALVVTERPLHSRVNTLCRRLGIPLRLAAGLADCRQGKLPVVSANRRAMMAYTSGTTSKPKGVVTTHCNIEAQVRTLIEAWQWRADDRIPLFLPLHHVHGIVNVLTCALWSGACVEVFESFDPGEILARVAGRAYTLFMAVPTIYVKLIRAIEAAPCSQREAFREGFKAMRLMVSGSAALPASVHRQWTTLTGQELLERYGMTELGMAISNPLHGERRPGSVGRPLPGVQVRLVTESGEAIVEEGEAGEIQAKGPGVFLEYWNQPEKTRRSFQDDWFKTGDVAVLEKNYYRILGRQSVDIIKSGGYKLSALEIEDALRLHPSILECSVVGVPDDYWGEIVTVVAILEQGAELELAELKTWAADRLSAYKIPKRIILVDDLPRNAMGKVMKPEVKKMCLKPQGTTETDVP
jgi:malonyl-CoA/methylmalonyl-CoA synthetase